VPSRPMRGGARHALGACRCVRPRFCTLISHVARCADDCDPAPLDGDRAPCRGTRASDGIGATRRRWLAACGDGGFLRCPPPRGGWPLPCWACRPCRKRVVVPGPRLASVCSEGLAACFLSVYTWRASRASRVIDPGYVWPWAVGGMCISARVFVAQVLVCTLR